MTLTSGFSSKKSCGAISLILFEAEFPYVMIGHILGLPSVGYCFKVTLTSDLSSRNIVSGAYLQYFRGRNTKFGVHIHLGILECQILFLGHCGVSHTVFGSL